MLGVKVSHDFAVEKWGVNIEKWCVLGGGVEWGTHFQEDLRFRWGFSFRWGLHFRVWEAFFSKRVFVFVGGLRFLFSLRLSLQSQHRFSCSACEVRVVNFAMGTTQNFAMKTRRANVNCNKNTLPISQTGNWLLWVFLFSAPFRTLPKTTKRRKTWWRVS